MMKLKTTNKLVMEQGIQHKNNLIELVGCNHLCHCDKEIENIVKENKICNRKNTFVKNFGFKHKFYYKVSHRKNLNFCSCEVALGHLEKIDDKIYIKKLSSVYVIDNGSTYVPYSEGFSFNCNCEEDGILIVTNHNPIELPLLSIDQNSILYSIGEGVSNLVHINKNSVVGRLNNNVESISIPSLLNQIIKYEDGKVKFYNGSRWINLVEEKDEDTK